jgi:hypothetical protein
VLQELQLVGELEQAHEPLVFQQLALELRVQLVLKVPVHSHLWK